MTKKFLYVDTYGRYVPGLSYETGDFKDAGASGSEDAPVKADVSGYIADTFYDDIVMRTNKNNTMEDGFLLHYFDENYASYPSWGDRSLTPKHYVDSVSAGLAVHTPTRVATTSDFVTTLEDAVYDNGTDGVGATLTNGGTQAALVIDEVALVLNDRVLVKDFPFSGNGERNGIYYVSEVGSESVDWVLTRSTDYDNAPIAEIHDGDYLFVTEGTENALTGWVQTIFWENGVSEVGTTDIVFSLFSSVGVLTAGPGLQKIINEFSLDIYGVSATTTAVAAADKIAYADTTDSNSTAVVTFQNVIDSQNIQTAISGGTDGNFVSINATDDIADSGSAPSDYAPVSHSHVVGDITDFTEGTQDVIGTMVATPSTDISWNYDDAGSGALTASVRNDAVTLAKLNMSTIDAADFPIIDANNHLAATTMEDALLELVSTKYYVDPEFLVTKGDLVYISANDTIAPYYDINVDRQVVGIANDTVLGYISGFDSSVYAIAIQTDGKILCGGEFTLYGNLETPYGLCRLNSDGSLDKTFNFGEARGFTDVGRRINYIAIQTDGKILVGGNFTTYTDSTGALANCPNYFCRVNADGTLDQTFNFGASRGFNDYVYTMKLLTSGKILVGGTFTSYIDSTGTLTSCPDCLCCVNADGTLDQMFNFGASRGFNIGVYSIDLQTDGKIIVGGVFTQYVDSTGTLTSCPDALCRVNADGTLDQTFNFGASRGFNDYVASIAVQADDKIICGGSFAQYIDSTGTLTSCPDNLCRVNADGTLDQTFNYGAGRGFDTNLNFVLLQTDEKIICGGSSFTQYVDSTGTLTSCSDRLCRVNTNGTLDQTFNYGVGRGFNDFVLAGALEADGKIIVGGAFDDYIDGGTPPTHMQRRLCRINSTDGTIEIPRPMVEVYKNNKLLFNISGLTAGSRYFWQGRSAEVGATGFDCWKLNSFPTNGSIYVYSAAIGKNTTTAIIDVEFIAKTSGTYVPPEEP
jgi:uncharacterized delta-60 repeat protein